MGVTLRKTEVVLEVPPPVQNPGCCVPYLDAVLVCQVLVCDMSMNMGAVCLHARDENSGGGKCYYCEKKTSPFQAKTFIVEEIKNVSCILYYIDYLTDFESRGGLPLSPRCRRY